MSAPGKFRFVSSDRRVREDRRFVVGKGRFAADIVPAGIKHVALVTCPHPAARIVSIDKAAALAMPGVHYVLDGARACRRDQRCWPRASTRRTCRAVRSRVDVARYAGEWVAAVVADTPRARRGRRRAGRAWNTSRCRSCSTARRPIAGGTLVHEAHGSNVLLDRTFVWGEVEQDFADEPAHAQALASNGAAARRCRSRPSA